MKRRTFIKKAAASGLAINFIPSSVWGANERVHVASIGIGGKGASDVQGVHKAGAKIVALCDVNEGPGRKGRKNHARDNFADAPFYKDFRVMLEKEEKNIDAVTVSTPDHVHALASVTAMRMGKHVYCQKPLSHSIWEARLMTEVAAEKKVCTQMGNQAHANEPIRRAVELIRGGIIGKVSEVHAWTNRPIWPQGMKKRPESQTAPDSLDWDLWLGPAPERPYHPDYAPFKWRGWWDFGTGALGDMGCHIMDMPFWALELDAPETVDAQQIGNSKEAGPTASEVLYRFPAGKYSHPLKFSWYDGGLMPHNEVFDGTPVDSRSAKKFNLIMIGDKGKLLFNRSSEKWVTCPEGLAEDVNPPQSIPRITGKEGEDIKAYREDLEWIQAIKGGAPAQSHFDYSGPFTETVLLGNLAVRLGRKIEWDSANLRVKNAEKKAAPLIRRTYRPGWELA